MQKNFVEGIKERRNENKRKENEWISVEADRALSLELQTQDDSAFPCTEGTDLKSFVVNWITSKIESCCT